jgi:hypothetical protein
VGLSQEQNLALELESSEQERVLNELLTNEILEHERAGEG